jgi:multiple antibiotic resistance protein
MPDFKEIVSVTIILFSIIDIIGSIPVVIDLKKKAGNIESAKATLVAGIIMIVFLFLGASIIQLFGIDVYSFAIAGAIILFLIGFEMVLGITLFRHESASASSTSIVPLAFPLIAGAGTMTTIITLRAEYQVINILSGIIINLLLVFIVLRSCDWLEKRIGSGGFIILRKVMGIILLAIAIKLIKSNLILP